MKFCSCCGAPVALGIPSGDNRPRHICASCGEIHYVNPKVIVGAIVEHEGRILLCRRGIEPRYGMWTLPAGFMEMHETTGAGAQRETLEEACAEIELIAPYTLVNVTHIGQVHLLYRARLAQPGFGAGEESLEVRLLDETEIPWDALAFRSISTTLHHYFADRARGHFEFRVIDLAPPPA